MNTFKNRVRITRKKKGSRRHSNIATKKLAELQAAADIKKQLEAEEKQRLLDSYTNN